MSPDNKTNFKVIENELSKILSKVSKDITGRGPISAEARVLNQAIFVQFKIDRNNMENLLFKYLESKNLEYDFYDFVRPTFITVTNIAMRKLNPSLSVEGMEFRVEDGQTYILITLNKNLEKMLLSGEAKLSHVHED